MSEVKKKLNLDMDRLKKTNLSLAKVIYSEIQATKKLISNPKSLSLKEAPKLSIEALCNEMNRRRFKREKEEAEELEKSKNSAYDDEDSTYNNKPTSPYQGDIIVDKENDMWSSYDSYSGRWLAFGMHD